MIIVIKMRECVNCKYSKGIGSDVYCGHNPKGNETYMSETDCPYFKIMNEQQSTIKKQDIEIQSLNLHIEKLVDGDEISQLLMREYEISDGLEKENKELKKQLKKKNTMDMQLREINKEIGDDLHKCRLNKNIISEKLKLWQDVHKKYGIYNINDFEELMKNVKQKR